MRNGDIKTLLKQMILCYSKGIQEVVKVDEQEVCRRMALVNDALRERGYRPVEQIIGYILTEDPTYITHHNDARKLISRIDRETLLNDIVASYFECRDNQNNL